MSSDAPAATCQHCHAEMAADALFCPACGTPRARADGDPLIGEIVADRYLLQRRLGHGGSGTIYLAEHVTLRRKVAIKIIHHELSRDDLAVERFRREATTVGTIDNDHIVEVYDFGRAPDGRLFLAMEYLEGETLADVLARGERLPVAQVVEILIQLGEALMEAHAMGYIHRDLRPRNVFLTTRRGRPRFVKLLDFGLAKLVEKESEAAGSSLGMTFGDPRYMSPEQAYGGESFDRRADIYSLGVMSWEMLVGRPPFGGTRVFEVITKHLEETPHPPSTENPEVPPWLDAIVLRAMAKRPGERFVTVCRLVEALEAGRTSGSIMTDDAARSMPNAELPPPAPRLRQPDQAGSSAGQRGPAEAAPGGSATWFADGEAMGTGGAAGESGMDGAAYPDDQPPRRHVLWIGIGLAGAGLATGLTAFLWPQGTKAPGGGMAGDGGPAEVAVAPVIDAGPAPPLPIDAGAARPGAGGRAAGTVTAVRGGGGGRGAAVPSSGIPRPPVLDASAEAASPSDGVHGGTGDGQAAQAAALVKLGEAALRSGDVVGAVANFNRAREFDPRNAEAIAGLGQVALRQGYAEEATVHLEAATRLAPRSARIHTLRGEAYLAAGKRKQAATAFKAALKLQPDNETARKGYEEATAAEGASSP